jgi:hypothetical protein
MVLSLLKRLEKSHEVAHTTSLILDGGVMQHTKDSRKTRITIQYLDYLAPVNESDMLVLPMRAYDLVLGLPGIHKRHPDIDWAHQRLTALQATSASGAAEITPMTTPVASKV